MVVRSELTKKIMPAMLASLLIFLLIAPLRASNLIPCPMKVRYFTTTQGANGKTAVGACLDVGIYPVGTNTQLVTARLRALPRPKRNAYIEWLVTRELQFRRQGNLEKLLKLYAKGASQKMARSLYSNMAYTQKFAGRVSTEQFRLKARFGPVTLIDVDTVTPEYKFAFGWSFYIIGSRSSGWRFVKRPPATTLFSAIAGMYPYWLPANKQTGFTPTKNYFRIARHYSKKFPKPDAAVYIRKIRVFPPAIVKAVRNILHVYQTGSDKDIVALWRPKDQKVWARRLAAHRDTSSDMRDPFKDKRGFRVFPSILGRDVAFVLLQPLSGGSVVKLRLAKINGNWYQSRLSDANTPIDWLPKYPGYEAYVLANRKVSVVIKSAGH